MKKKLITLLTSLTLVAVLLATLCGCSTYGGIKSAFEKEGYTESENVQSYQTTVMEWLNAESDEEVEQICTLHVMTKTVLKGEVAIIFEFSSTDKMNEQIEKSEMLKGAIKDVQNSKFVNGNCILCPIAISSVISIFEKA